VTKIKGNNVHLNMYLYVRYIIFWLSNKNNVYFSTQREVYKNIVLELRILFLT